MCRQVSKRETIRGGIKDFATAVHSIKSLRPWLFLLTLRLSPAFVI